MKKPLDRIHCCYCCKHLFHNTHQYVIHYSAKQKQDQTAGWDYLPAFKRNTIK